MPHVERLDTFYVQTAQSVALNYEKKYDSLTGDVAFFRNFLFFVSEICHINDRETLRTIFYPEFKRNCIQ